MTKNIKYFFTIIDSFIKNQKKNKMPILIFKNENNNYSCVFMINSILSDNTKCLLKMNYDDVKNKFQKYISLENINIFELNYILYIFNMKYNVLTNVFDEFNKKNIIDFYSCGAIFNDISIHISKDIMNKDILEQHFIGTKNNSFKYDKWVYNDSVKEELRNNSSISYEEYCKILNYYYNNSKNPIKDAYSYSFKNFKDIYTNQSEVSHVKKKNYNIRNLYKRIITSN